MNQLTTLFEDNGYTIHSTDGAILLGWRSTFRAGVAALIALGVASMACYSAVSVISEAPDHPHHQLAGGVFSGMALLAAALAAVFYRIYARSRDLSRQRIPARWVVDLRRRELCTPDGRALCPLDQVQLTIGINLLNATRGLMRTLNMRWPGGRGCVMTSGDLDEIKRIRRMLVEAGMVQRGLD